MNGLESLSTTTDTTSSSSSSSATTKNLNASDDLTSSSTLNELNDDTAGFETVCARRQRKANRQNKLKDTFSDMITEKQKLSSSSSSSSSSPSSLKKKSSRSPSSPSPSSSASLSSSLSPSTSKPLNSITPPPSTSASKASSVSSSPEVSSHSPKSIWEPAPLPTVHAWGGLGQTKPSLNVVNISQELKSSSKENKANGMNSSTSSPRTPVTRPSTPATSIDESLSSTASKKVTSDTPSCTSPSPSPTSSAHSTPKKGKKVWATLTLPDKPNTSSSFKEKRQEKRSSREHSTTSPGSDKVKYSSSTSTSTSSSATSTSPLKKPISSSPSQQKPHRQARREKPVVDSQEMPSTSSIETQTDSAFLATGITTSSLNHSFHSDICSSTVQRKSALVGTDSTTNLPEPVKEVKPTLPHSESKDENSTLGPSTSTSNVSSSSSSSSTSSDINTCATDSLGSLSSSPTPLGSTLVITASKFTQHPPVRDRKPRTINYSHPHQRNHTSASTFSYSHYSNSQRSNASTSGVGADGVQVTMNGTAPLPTTNGGSVYRHPKNNGAYHPSLSSHPHNPYLSPYSHSLHPSRPLSSSHQPHHGLPHRSSTSNSSTNTNTVPAVTSTKAASSSSTTSTSSTLPPPDGTFRTPSYLPYRPSHSYTAGNGTRLSHSYYRYTPPYHTSSSGLVSTSHPSTPGMMFPSPLPPSSSSSSSYSHPSLYPPKDPVSVKKCLQAQIEYYFSVENLCKDVYIRQHMDVTEGWVDLSFLANFNRVKLLTDNLNVLVSALDTSEVVELNETKTWVRRRGDWERWIFPSSSFSITSSSSSTSTSLSSSTKAMTSLKETEKKVSLNELESTNVFSSTQEPLKTTNCNSLSSTSSSQVTTHEDPVIANPSSDVVATAS